MSELIEAPRREVALESAAPANSPMGMMLAALQQGANLEQIEKMMDLQERWEHRQAEKAYNDALAAFKAEAVEVIKRREVDFTSQKGRTHYKHAELSDVVAAVGPALSKHGFAWSWKTQQEKDVIRVTCILKHRQGHSDSVTLEAGADQSGNKNSIQAIASTVTYLQRHTLKAITGVSEKGDDTDGQAPDADAIKEEWISQVARCETAEQVDEVWKAGCDAIGATNDLRAFSVFKRAVSDKRKFLKEQ